VYIPTTLLHPLSNAVFLQAPEELLPGYERGWKFYSFMAGQPLYVPWDATRGIHALCHDLRLCSSDTKGINPQAGRLYTSRSFNRFELLPRLRHCVDHWFLSFDQGVTQKPDV